jgi:hypothetical protein
VADAAIGAADEGLWLLMVFLCDGHRAIESVVVEGLDSGWFLFIR